MILVLTLNRNRSSWFGISTVGWLCCNPHYHTHSHRQHKAVISLRSVIHSAHYMITNSHYQSEKTIVTSAPVARTGSITHQPSPHFRPLLHVSVDIHLSSKMHSSQGPTLTVAGLPWRSNHIKLSNIIDGMQPALEGKQANIEPAVTISAEVRL